MALVLHAPQRCLAARAAVRAGQRQVLAAHPTTAVVVVGRKPAAPS